MEHPNGIPAAELSDTELERQGTRAHATRHWVYLHGTAEQFQRHTERMLELEEEYLRRHPKRTWQGSEVGDQAAPLDQVAQLRLALRTFAGQMEELLAELDAAQRSAPAVAEPEPTDPGDAQVRLLSRFADAPQQRLHKLEAHQVARALAVHPEQLAQLYKQDPALLAAAGSYRYLTDAGQEWLAGQRAAVGDG